MKKSFSINPLTTNNAIYRDSLTLTTENIDRWKLPLRCSFNAFSREYNLNIGNPNYQPTDY